jgi:hypothetical protein
VVPDAILGPRIDDVVDATAVPDVRILLPTVGWIGHAGDRGPLRVDAVDVGKIGRGIRPGGLLHPVGTAQGVRDRDEPVALRDLVPSVVARHEADVGFVVCIAASAAGRAGGGGNGLDAVGLDLGDTSGPRTVERRRPVNGEGDGLADHDRVASVGQLERRHVVPSVRVVVRVHEPLPHVGPQHPLAADGVVGIRALPAGIESRRAGPGAHEHVVLAVLGFEDLAVPVVELRRNGGPPGALDSVAQVARQHARHAPGGRAERRADDGRRLDVVDERFRIRDLRDAEARARQHKGDGNPTSSVGRLRRAPRDGSRGLGGRRSGQASSKMHSKSCLDAGPVVTLIGGDLGGAANPRTPLAFSPGRWRESRGGQAGRTDSRIRWTG